MNKHFILLGATTVLLFSCSREADQVIRPGETITFTAGWAGSDETRTILQSDGTSVWWDAAEQINVFFSDKASGKFTSTNSQPQAIVDFQGSLPIVVGSVEIDNPAHSYWAVYPYNAANICDGESVTLTIPSSQTAKEGTFADKMFPSVATSTNFYLAFYNVCGGVRFTVANEGIASVTFKANNGESLAGKVKVGFDGIPMVESVIEGASEVVVNAPTGGFVPGKYYFAAFLPQTLSKGVSLTFKKEDGKVATTNLDNNITINRSRFGKMEEKDKGLEFKDDGSGPNPSDNIVFADLIAKYACVEKYDTDGDGEVSYKEAAAVTSLSGLFTDWNTVTSFEELKYFTGVTSTSGVFNGLTKLDSLTVPNNITTLGTFQGCTSLKKVVLPDALTSLPTSCFDGCSALKDLNMPSGLTTVPNNCFWGCKSLVSVELPSGLKTIGDFAFLNCTSLSGVDFPASLTSIGLSGFSGCTALTSVTLGTGTSIDSSAFSGCTALTTVVLPEDMTTMRAYCFRMCTSLSTITWPSTLTTIEDGAFADSRFEDSDYTLQLPSSITTIGSKAFGLLHHLILPSTSPVLIESDSFVKDYTVLYVPAGMVEMYKIRTNWSNYAGKIVPISAYPLESSIGGTTGEVVDLGLSVKWSSWNVGASAPEEYGAYFAWGETDVKWDYNWSTYKWCEGTGSTLTKYNTKSSYGIVDLKTVLDAEDDAATLNWGSAWRTATDDEWRELRENCTWTWTDDYNGSGVAGRIVTSNIEGYTSNSIFLPAAGRRLDAYRYTAGSIGRYWSSSLREDHSDFAFSLYFDSDGVDWNNIYRCYGQSVRPVFTE